MTNFALVFQITFTNKTVIRHEKVLFICISDIGYSIDQL